MQSKISSFLFFCNRFITLVQRSLWQLQSRVKWLASSKCCHFDVCQWCKRSKFCLLEQRQRSLFICNTMLKVNQVIVVFWDSFYYETWVTCPQEGHSKKRGHRRDWNNPCSHIPKFNLFPTDTKLSRFVICSLNAWFIQWVAIMSQSLQFLYL